MEVRTKVFAPLVAILLFTLLQIQVSASKKSYIVYLGSHSHGAEASLEDFERATNFHYEFLSSFLGSKEKAQDAIFYSYTKSINGFAAKLEEEEAMQISKHPRVVSLFENKVLKLHTTRSWGFIELEQDGRVLSSSIWAKARYGEDAIIATLDTGVWPESKSFSDEGMGPVPSRWKGSCVNNTKKGVPCNRKLIGAKYFDKGFLSSYNGGDELPPASARDYNGHGTHTLSTVGGRFVSGASMLGHANGTAKGGAPNSRVAVYKVCWGFGCTDADILAGYDEAIHDGVDVISVSLGGLPISYVTDSISLGAFHAVMRGIIVVCSVGNSGPDEGSVTNTPPWVVTVGASTLDRSFPSFLTLRNKKQLKGESLSEKGLPENKLFPLINSTDARAANASTVEYARYCFMGSLDPKKVKGKIVVCELGNVVNCEKGKEVLNAGGIGMVIINDEFTGNVLQDDAHFLPATNIGYSDGLVLRSYLRSTKAPMATISGPGTQLGLKPSPMMPDFSSRGPSLLSPQILKPDITAPGVNILAAYSEAISPTGLIDDDRRIPYMLMSGTSMSCPHVAGVAGLLKTLHSDWSPAAIRSAIMTTARTRDNTGSPIKDSSGKATPFDYGSGHIRPNRAMDPGLVYDTTVDDYLDFLCALGYNSSLIASYLVKNYKCPLKPKNPEDLNYPSISVPILAGSAIVTRTLKNVGAPGTYKVRVEAPVGISVSVKPSILKFDKVGEEKVFKVGLKSHADIVGVGYQFGMLIWSDGKHYVRSPMAVNAMS